MSSIRTIHFKDHKIRLVQMNDQIYYVALDVASILGYQKASYMTRVISGSDKTFATINTSGGDQSMIVISAWGLLTAAVRRKAPQAKELCLWVIGHDVEPVAIAA